MSSVFSQKVEAVRDKIPESVLETPWKRTLLLVVFLIGAITAVLFFAIFGLLKGIFGASGKMSLNTPTAEEIADMQFAQNNFGGRRGSSVDAYGRVPGEYAYGNPLIPPDDTDEEQGW